MNIIVKDSSTHFWLLLPTGLLLNRLSARIVSHFLKKANISLTRSQAMSLIKAIKRYKRRHHKWKLVEVQGKNRDRVEIKL